MISPGPAPSRLEAGAPTLVVNMMGMGDLIMMTPALRALRNTLPGSRIGVVCRAPFDEVLADNDAVDEIFPFSHTRIRWLRNRNAKRLTRDVARSSFSQALFIDRYRGMPDWIRAAGVTASRCFLRTGPEGAVTTLENPAPLDHTSPEPIHITEQCHRFVTGLTGEAHPLGSTEIHITDTHRAAAASLLDLSRDYWVVHAGLSTTTRFRWPFERRGKIVHRAWPLDHWARVLPKLIESRGGDIVLTGTAPEAAIARQLRALLPAELHPRVHILAGRTRPMVLAAILERARGYLGLDTGPMHLAAAAGTPIVALYGPTDPRVCGPVGRGRAPITITEPVSCSPCRGDTRRSCRDNVCMKGIAPERLLAAAEEAGL